MKPQKQQKGRIAPRQIKIIHTVVNKLGMDKETYWELLRRFGCKDRDCGDGQPPHPTSKDLSWWLAESLCEELQRKTGTTPQPPPKLGGGARQTQQGLKGGGGKKYSELDGRPGMATGAQCRMIAAMWGEVSRANTDEERERALWSFLRRIAHVDHFRFLKRWQVQVVVKAIEEMKKAKAG